MVGNHCIKTWSATQQSITLSSGEAELVAAVRVSSELLGLCQLAHDWGIELEGEIMVDSAAAIGVMERRGCGKMRHARVGMLWMQELVENEDLRVAKVPGTQNPADLMTKHLAFTVIEVHMGRLSQGWAEGRADSSLQL